ncbi:hypothetical protein DIPPA_29622 [Diplonema papillatum]|nr:hypothetical protein DIPPA_29622 [Diplonema papillatum]
MYPPSTATGTRSLSQSAGSRQGDEGLRDRIRGVLPLLLKQVSRMCRRRGGARKLSGAEEAAAVEELTALLLGGAACHRALDRVASDLLRLREIPPESPPGPQDPQGPADPHFRQGSPRDIPCFSPDPRPPTNRGGHVAANPAQSLEHMDSTNNPDDAQGTDSRWYLPDGAGSAPLHARRGTPAQTGVGGPLPERRLRSEATPLYQSGARVPGSARHCHQAEADPPEWDVDLSDCCLSDAVSIRESLGFGGGVEQNVVADQNRSHDVVHRGTDSGDCGIDGVGGVPERSSRVLPAGKSPRVPAAEDRSLSRFAPATPCSSSACEGEDTARPGAALPPAQLGRRLRYPDGGTPAARSGSSGGGGGHAPSLSACGALGAGRNGSGGGCFAPVPPPARGDRARPPPPPSSFPLRIARGSREHGSCGGRFERQELGEGREDPRSHEQNRATTNNNNTYYKSDTSDNNNSNDYNNNNSNGNNNNIPPSGEEVASSGADPGSPQRRQPRAPADRDLWAKMAAIEAGLHAAEQQRARDEKRAAMAAHRRALDEQVRALRERAASDRAAELSDCRAQERAAAAWQEELEEGKRRLAEKNATEKDYRDAQLRDRLQRKRREVDDKRREEADLLARAEQEEQREAAAAAGRKAAVVEAVKRNAHYNQKQQLRQLAVAREEQTLDARLAAEHAARLEKQEADRKAALAAIAAKQDKRQAMGEALNESMRTKAQEDERRALAAIAAFEEEELAKKREARLAADETKRRTRRFLERQVAHQAQARRADLLEGECDRLRQKHAIEELAAADREHEQRKRLANIACLQDVKHQIRQKLENVPPSMSAHEHAVNQKFLSRVLPVSSTPAHPRADGMPPVPPSVPRMSMARSTAPLLPPSLPSSRCVSVCR